MFVKIILWFKIP